MRPAKLAQLLDWAIKHREPILITGAPGIGKSDIVAQAADSAGCDLKIFHPAVSDPTDFKGLPARTGEHSAEFLPYGDLAELVDATTPTVAFLDDLGQAPPAVQAACMQLLLARRVNGHSIADCVTFVAATNRKSDKAGVTGILEPVKSRFTTIVELETHIDDWSQWATTNNMPPEIIAFLRFRPQYLHDFTPSADLKNSPSPRTCAAIGRQIRDGLPAALQHESFTGSAGESLATELVGFLEIWTTLPSIDQILLNPDAAPVPDAPAALYAVSAALAARANQNNMQSIVKYAARMPEEFTVATVADAVRRAPETASTAAFIKFAADNGDILTGTV